MNGSSALGQLDGQQPASGRQRAGTRLAVLLWAAVLTLAAGCSSNKVSTPDVDAQEAAQKAMAEYDRNKDGVLDEQELEACPALKMCLKGADKNGDGRLSRDEIADRIASYYKDGVGLMAASCNVRLDGEPLAGATVTYEPETFLGSALKSATGITDKTGKAVLQTQGEDSTGVQCGLYRVRISKKDASGRELLPAHYNRKTTLGQEVAPVGRSTSGGVFELSSN